MVPENHNVTSDVLQDALILSLENIIDAWVVDLGASFHATPDKIGRASCRERV